MAERHTLLGTEECRLFSGHNEYLGTHSAVSNQSRLGVLDVCDVKPWRKFQSGDIHVRLNGFAVQCNTMTGMTC